MEDWATLRAPALSPAAASTNPWRYEAQIEMDALGVVIHGSGEIWFFISVSRHGRFDLGHQYRLGVLGNGDRHLSILPGDHKMSGIIHYGIKREEQGLEWRVGLRRFGADAGDVFSGIVTVGAEELDVGGENNVPRILAGSREQGVGSGGDLDSAELNRPTKGDLRRFVGPGTPDLVVWHEAAKHLAALGGGAGVVDLDLGQTHRLLDRGTWTRCRKINLALGQGGGER